MELRRTHMAKLSCGNWQRVSDRLVDLEELTGGIEFGMGSPREYPCTVHGIMEDVIDRTFWEWHVFCLSCGFNSWHGVDAEKARQDYERHEKLPGHSLRVGLDGFTGDVDDETSQGTLFVSDKVTERRRDSKDKKLEAVKRHAASRSRKTREETPTPTVSEWKPSGTAPRVTFEELAARARKKS